MPDRPGVGAPSRKNVPMTLLLASVTGPEEAETVIANGADIVDLKDPGRGALGALSLADVRVAVQAVAGRRPVSAVTGDLPMEPAALVAAAAGLADAGVDTVKVGLFQDPRRRDCIRALTDLARRVQVVGVLFADQEPDISLVGLMAEHGFAGAMLDTAHKGAGRLLDHMGVAALREFVAAAQANGLLAGLAGSLEVPDIPRLLLLEPDLLGFRRALCVGQERTARIDAAAVALVRDLIPLDRRSRVQPAPAAADYRVLAARGYAVDPKDSGDRIFVRDLVLPVRVGAYAHEHEKPQNVRFDVEVSVTRPLHAVGDMRDVLSYDVITDGIRILATKEHVALVETLAEQVAGFVLAHPRAVAVRVRVEKLDVGPGGVGVEIRRERQGDTAKVFQLFPAAADTKTRD